MTFSPGHFLERTLKGDPSTLKLYHGHFREKAGVILAGGLLPGGEMLRMNSVCYTGKQSF